MSSLKSIRIYKKGRPFNRKSILSNNHRSQTNDRREIPQVHDALLYRSEDLPQPWRGDRERRDLLRQAREQLKLDLDNNVRYIEREIQVVKDNPIIRLRVLASQPESPNIKVETHR